MADRGLEGVVVGKSAISYVDGKNGELTYRGYNIQDLAEKCTFEEVAYLIWYGNLPNRSELKEMSKRLAAHRFGLTDAERLLGQFPKSAPPMSVLRTAISLLGMYDPRAESNAVETNLEMAFELTAQAAGIVANFHRMRVGGEIVPAEPGLSHAANFLHRMTGRIPEELHARIFDNCLLLHMDHDFNASTYTARVTASTLSDIYSAITSAIGSLRGPLHGGANTRVMIMLKEIGDPSNAEEYVKNLLAKKERVMGFGHRIYKTVDPRAVVLRRWCHQLGEQLGNAKWCDMQSIIEEVMLKEKGLHANVDFYSASVYDMLGIPMDLFTPIFAMSRIVGWTAHVREQYAHNRLIRPSVNYTGLRNQPIPPIDER